MTTRLPGLPALPCAAAISAIALAALLFASPVGCLAQTPPATSQPGDNQPTANKPAATQPAGDKADAAALSSGDARVDEILDRLDARGRSVRGLACEVTYRFVTVEPVESEQIKEGSLLYARAPASADGGSAESSAEVNARFLIHFRKLSADGIVRETGEYWAFDGQWLVERNDKSRTIVRRQIARPGERKDPFKLGQGPFPLPLGQKRRDILENFTVRLEPFALGDPRNSEHLYCVPRPGTALAKKYTRVDIFVDRGLELPVRITAERRSDANRIQVDFRNIDTDQAPAASRFSVEAPKDYDVSVEPIDQADATGALP